MIPLWIKLCYTIVVIIIIIVYFQKYGPGNFLWFSDIALIIMVPALWIESRLLASTMAVGVLLPEIFWNLSFFTKLISGKRISGISDYMFDQEKPVYLRALSLFHIVLPVLLLWTVAQLGYYSFSWFVQTAVAWVILPLSYLLTDPKENVNWVHGWSDKPKKKMPPLLYLGLLIIFFPLFVYLPTHLILKLLFG